MNEQKGFTLLELLIAVSLTAILVTALYGTFFSTLKANVLVEESLDKYLETGRFLDRFEQELNAAYYKPANQRTIFSGEKRGLSSELSFASFTHPTVREGIPTSDLSTIRYFVDEENGKNTIYKEIWNPYTENKFKVEALKGFKGFEVSFLNGKDWALAWDSSLEKRLPDAIKVSVVMEDGKELSALAVPKITTNN